MRLADLSVEALCWLEKVIYSDPREREALVRKPLLLIADMLLLVGKYDFRLVEDLAKLYFEKHAFKLQFEAWKGLHGTCAALQLQELKALLELKLNLERLTDAEFLDLPSSLVVARVGPTSFHFKGTSGLRFFKRCVHYAITKDDEAVLAKLKNVENTLRNPERKYEYEARLKDALLDLLISRTAQANHPPGEKDHCLE